MNHARRGNWLGVFAVSGVALVLQARPAPAQLDPGGPPPATAGLPEGAQVLTRGPVHEAFAEPVVFDPRPGPVVPKEPPPPVDEVPPDQRPEGANVQWIPGYWAWDDGRGDFLWISGLWRDLPPGRQWVPGYWGEVNGGYRWIPGAWTAAAQQDVQYYPVPPASLEAGPSSPPPSPDSVWSPGYWDWQGSRFVWRPGFWLVFRPEWVWVPAHYVWTPNGCLFVDGYWDLPVVRRGTPFAPVYFAQPALPQTRIIYTPTISLLASAMVTSFFVRPSYNQYYFGDYYAESYNQAGIVPWYAFHQGRGGYDPMFAHYSVVQSRRDPRWLDRMQDDYRFRRENPDARPPHTYIEQQNIANRTTVNNVRVTNVQNSVTNVRNLVVARPISQVATNPDQPLRFTRVDAARRQELTRQVEQVREFRQQRAKQELQTARTQERADLRGPGRAMTNLPGPDARPRRLEPFRSPIAAAASGQPSAGPNPGLRAGSPGGPQIEARQRRLEQLKAQGEQADQLKAQRQMSETLKAQRQRQSLEELQAQRQQQREQLNAQQNPQRLEQQKAQRQRELAEQQQVQRQQLEQLKSQRQREQAERPDGPRQQRQQQLQNEQPNGQRQMQLERQQAQARQQLQAEQLRNQRQQQPQNEQPNGQRQMQLERQQQAQARQQLQAEQLRNQRQQQLQNEQLRAQQPQQRQPNERMRAQQLEQMNAQRQQQAQQAQRQQQLEQFKAQQRAKAEAGERPQRKNQ